VTWASCPRIPGPTARITATKGQWTRKQRPTTLEAVTDAKPRGRAGSIIHEMKVSCRVSGRVTGATGAGCGLGSARLRLRRPSDGDHIAAKSARLSSANAVHGTRKDQNGRLAWGRRMPR